MLLGHRVSALLLETRVRGLVLVRRRGRRLPGGGESVLRSGSGKRGLLLRRRVGILLRRIRVGVLLRGHPIRTLLRRIRVRILLRRSPIWSLAVAGLLRSGALLTRCRVRVRVRRPRVRHGSRLRGSHDRARRTSGGVRGRLFAIGEVLCERRNETGDDREEDARQRHDERNPHDGSDAHGSGRSPAEEADHVAHGRRQLSEDDREVEPQEGGHAERHRGDLVDAERAHELHARGESAHGDQSARGEREQRRTEPREAERPHGGMHADRVDRDGGEE